MVDAVRGEDLHTREDMAPPRRSAPSDVELAEGCIRQHLAVGAQRLFENLPAVRDEEQRGFAPVLAQPPVVQRRDDGLPRAGGGDDQVVVMAVDGACHLEPVEDLLLVRVWTHVQAGHR